MSTRACIRTLGGVIFTSRYSMKFGYSALLAAGSVPRYGNTVPKRGLPSAPLFLYVEIALRVRRSYVASKGDAARKNACATKQNGRGSGGRRTDGGGGKRDPARLDPRYGTAPRRSVAARRRTDKSSGRYWDRLRGHAWRPTFLRWSKATLIRRATRATPKPATASTA